MLDDMKLRELFKNWEELRKQRPGASVTDLLRDQPELLQQMMKQLTVLETSTPASTEPTIVETTPAASPPATVEQAPQEAPAPVPIPVAEYASSVVPTLVENVLTVTPTPETPPAEPAPSPFDTVATSSKIGGKTIANTLKMKLTLISAGEFWMGSPETDRYASEDELPRHKVKISNRFYLGVHQVTHGQFRTFTSEAPYTTEAERAGGGWGYNAETYAYERDPRFTWRFVGWEQSDEHPVINVTWNDAQAFCQWLSRRESMTYRLPTEAEWEYACRAGTKTRFFGMDGEGTMEMLANTADESLRERLGGVYAERKFHGGTDNFPFAAPVGQFHNNAWGLYDMHGNVWEWCADWYDKDYYQNSPDVDPPGPPTGADRVIRGGSWNDLPRDCRSASRNAVAPHRRDQIIGFRVVLDISGK